MNFLQLKINNKTKNKFNGFTLVETLVGISILLMAVVAPLVLITSNITAVFSVKDKITALYLAEDAVDYVKYKIDTNFNKGDTNWLAGIDPWCINGNSCEVDSYNDNVGLYTGTVLKFNSNTTSPTSGVYGYTSSWQDSKFRRIVTVANASQDPNPNTPLPDEVIITATILWQDHGVEKQTTISEHAFAWVI